MRKSRIRFLSFLCLLFLALVSSAIIMPQRASAATTPDGYVYTASGSEATITGYTGSGGNITIPKIINNGVFDLTVTGIDDNAFSFCTKIASVTIPDSVTSIGNSAFYFCSNLTSVTISDSVTSIGDSAFEGCSSLISVTIPDSVTNIGNNSFTNCTSLQSIDVSSSNEYYTSIDGVLFNKSANLVIAYPGGKSGAYIIPDSVSSIGDSTFSWCTKLTSVTIPDSVTIIGNSAFYFCSSLTGMTIPGNVTSIGDSAFEGCSNLTSMIIPDSVTSIGNSTFNCCFKIDSVTIPDSVTSIGNNAFGCLTKLTSVTIPDSVTSIGNNPFDNCPDLKSIDVSSSNEYYTSIDGVLFNKSANLIIAYPGGKSGAYIIPDSVTIIGDSAFSCCTNLTSVTIPDSVTSIGNNAFYSTDITSVTIPSNVTSIGDSAFTWCTKLTGVTIPDSVTSIGDSAFGACDALIEAWFLGNAPTMGYSVFSGSNFNANPDFRVYYLCGKTGFTNSWNGYKTLKIGIEVTTPPTKTDYVTGDSIDLNGLVVTGYYNDGTTGIIPASMLSISGFDSSTPVMGQIVTVTVNERTATFTVNILPQTYRLTFNSNGGSNVANQSVNYNEKALKPDDPTRTGYTFGGWYTDDNTFTESFDFGNTAITRDITLYAKWTINSYTVTFDSQGGSIVLSKSADYNSLITAPTNPTKTGYTFGGWYKEPECINACDFAADKVTSDATLYAKWTINSYTATYNSNGGSAVPSQSTNYNEKISKPVDPVRIGYTFEGWYTDNDTFNNLFDFANIAITGDITLYAKWTINIYTVTFDSQGGSTVASKAADYNSTITAPAAPTKTGYTFGGWYKEADCISVWNFSTDTVTDNTTLYAKWVINPVTGVTLDKTSATLKIGDTLTLVATVDPSDASNNNVTWSSSNTSAVTVDSTGKVTAVGNGVAAITVRTDDGGYTASCLITAGNDSYIEICNFVTRLYQLCLGRMPDESGLNFWVNGLVNKTFTGAEASYHFIFSQEFIDKGVGDNEFVDIMYKAFFDRTADDSGKAYWLARLANGNSRLFVLSSFVNSDEFNAVCSNYGINRGVIVTSKPQDLYPNITEFVYRLYDKCLGRKPDDSGLNFYVDQLASGKMSGSSAAYNFVFSAELTSRNLSNTDFTTVLYRVFLNREPDAAGLAYHVSKLDSGSSRNIEFYDFASSDEFANICNSYGIRVK